MTNTERLKQAANRNRLAPQTAAPAQQNQVEEGAPTGQAARPNNGNQSGYGIDVMRTFVASLRAPAAQKQMAGVIRNHLNPERMTRIALTELRKNPLLAQCTPESFVASVIQCAALGLEPGGVLGHVYLVPFWNTQAGQYECQAMLGYRGMILLARNSGEVSTINVRAVYDCDSFEVTQGTTESIVHKPNFTDPKFGNLKYLMAVYAVALLKDGATQHVIVSRLDIERAKMRSQTGKKNNGPWASDYEAMALKTAIRRLFKTLPVSIDAVYAANLDEQRDEGTATEAEDVEFEEQAEEGATLAQNGAANAVPQLDNKPGGVDPFETDGQPVTVALFAQLRQQLEKSNAPDVLDMVLDEVRALPDTPERADLLELAAEREAMMRQ